MADAMQLDLPSGEPSSATHGRGRSQTIVGPARDSEDFNEPSSARRDLLKRLDDILGHRPVPTPFWAVLLFADVSKLETFVDEAAKSTYFIEFVMHACAAMPLVWKQKAPQPPKSSSSGTCSDDSKNNRKETFIDRVRERHDDSCVIDGTTPVEVVHIYPHYLLGGRKTNFARSYPPFWDMLSFFWAPERIEMWHRQVFRDRSDPTKQFDSIRNMMCMSPTAHELWNRGSFVLKPVEINANETEMEVEFFWQAASASTMDDVLPVTTIPSTSRGLDGVYFPDSQKRSLLMIDTEEGPKKIATGHRIIIMTPDPEKLPLPSMELLDMQFALSRIVNLSGAGKVADLDDETQSEEDEGMALGKNKDVEDWVSSCEHSSDDEGSYDTDKDQPKSGDTSVEPSPAKVRTTQVDSSLSAELEQSLVFRES